MTQAPRKASGSGSVSGNVVYLDHAAATPRRAEILEQHARRCREYVANPHSSSCFSEAAKRALWRAADDVLALLGIPRDEATVVWTSGGTESVNLACLGVLRAQRRAVAAVEATAHPAVLEPCRRAARDGGACLELPVTAGGALDPDASEAAAAAEARLLAVCHVNNETGAMQDLVGLREWMRTRAPRARLMVDAMQSFGKFPIPWQEAAIDLLALSGRKIGGPAAVGALVCRRGVSMEPLFFGGGQQAGLRPGTQDVVGILEFAHAAALAYAEAESERIRITGLNRALRHALRPDSGCPVRLLSPVGASPYILSFCLPGYQGAVLMRLLAERGVVVGTGSACAAESAKPSPVLRAMGVSEREARGALRISFGHDSSAADVDAFVAALREVLQAY